MFRVPGTLLVASGKGGVGKTHVAANLAVIAAASGRRVVAVDLDPQANLGVALGVNDHDGGASLLAASMGIGELVLFDAYRDRMTYVASGVETQTMATFHTVKGNGSSRGLGEALAKVLEPLSGPDTLIVIDTPPTAGSILSEAALMIAERLVIPTREDQASIMGVTTLLDTVDAQADEGLGRPELAGVVLFGLDARATSIAGEARKDLDGLPVLPVFIRHSKKAAKDAMDNGVVASEYAAAGDVAGMRSLVAGNAAELAGDYRAVAIELELAQ